MDDEADVPDFSGEIQAISTVHLALKDLPTASQQRVVRWAMDAFAVAPTIKSGTASREGASAPADSERERSPTAETSSGFASFADLFGDASPDTDADKALVGGYWLQVVQGQEDFASQAVNEELKNTGNAIGNITRAFDNLRNSKPQLVRQLLKAGKAQQARKKLKLTTAGIERVRQMLAANS